MTPYHCPICGDAIHDDDAILCAGCQTVKADHEAQEREAYENDLDRRVSAFVERDQARRHGHDW